MNERDREWAEDGATETAALCVGKIDPSEPAAPKPFLVIRHLEQVTLLDLPAEGEWIVGRDPSAEVYVDDKQISRRHAKFRFAPGMIAIEDLGSRNGTVVNGRSVHGSTVRIGIGDVIEAGACQLVVAARTGRMGPTSSVSEAADPDVVDVVLADPEMARVYGSVRKVARMPTTTVLILGETGTGKDVLARRLHTWSQRADKPFARINCAGIPEALLESELFGHERGAFTGADRRKTGYFEATSGGTVFLDEIGELSAGAQAKLLHVLEKRTVARLGSTVELPVDVRIVCATHRDLRAMVADERFRADLYFRISPFVVRIPPLRERTTEIPLLANVFVRQFAEQIGCPPPFIMPDALSMLMAYAWPGNVRELRNAVEHAFAVAEGATLRIDHFEPEVRGLVAASVPTASRVRQRIGDAERAMIERALAAEGGNQTRAAARLGMPRRTLVYKLAQWRRDAPPDGKTGDDD